MVRLARRIGVRIFCIFVKIQHLVSALSIPKAAVRFFQQNQDHISLLTVFPSYFIDPESQKHVLDVI